MSDEAEMIAISMTAKQWGQVHDFLEYVEWSGVLPRHRSVRWLVKEVLLKSGKANVEEVSGD